MLKGPIPPHIDPRKLADRAAVLEGEWPVAQFSRLCEQLVSDTGNVKARFEFVLRLDRLYQLLQQ